MSSVLTQWADDRMVLMNLFLADTLLLCKYLASYLSGLAFINSPE